MKDIARIHRAGVILELEQIDKKLSTKYSLFWFEKVWEKQVCKIKTHDVDNRIIGFVANIDDEVMLYVDPEYHRQGIGTKLMGNESEVWVLDGNKMAEGFYGKNGFHKTEQKRRAMMFGLELNENLWRMGK